MRSTKTVTVIAWLSLAAGLLFAIGGGGAQLHAQTPEQRAKWPHWPLLTDRVPDDWPSQEQGVKDAAPSGLWAGVAKADVTPPYGAPMASWGSAVHVESNGADPVGMRVTALVLSDGKQTFAIVDVDAGGPDRDDVIERVSARTGIPLANIRLSGTHTHAEASVSVARIKQFGGGQVDPAPYERLMAQHDAIVAEKIVATVYAAQSQLRPVHMYGGRGIGTININRQFRGPDGTSGVGVNPEGFSDHELVVFRLDDADGNPYAVITNFQCHPTVLAFANTKISPDYPGMVRQIVEEALPGATALFLQGAAGNQGPVEGFTGDLNVPHRLGQILGHQAAAVALQVETVKREPTFEGFIESNARQAKQYWRVSGPHDQMIKFTSRSITVPGRRANPEELKFLDDQVAQIEAKLAAFGPNSQSPETLQARARLARIGGVRDRLRNYPTEPQPVSVHVSMLRIGDLVFVSMPGEPFSQIGYEIKKASPFAYTMFSGYSRYHGNVGGGYMAMSHDYDYDVTKFSTYELQASRYGKGAAEELIKQTISMFAELK